MIGRLGLGKELTPHQCLYWVSDALIYDSDLVVLFSKLSFLLLLKTCLVPMNVIREASQDFVILVRSEDYLDETF
jgi:hypothetical protein